MNPTHVVTLLAGLLVAGVAAWFAMETPVTSPEPCGELRLGPGESVPVPPPQAPAPPPRTLEEAQARIAVLEQELTQLRLAQQFAQGQLNRLEGDHQPWPADLADVWREPSLQASFQAAAESSTAFALLELDCEEFPCVAYFAHEGEGDMQEDLPTFMEGLKTTSLPDDAGMSVMAAMAEGPDGSVRGVAAVSVAPEALVTPELQTRTDHRVRGQLEEFLPTTDEAAVP